MTKYILGLLINIFFIGTIAFAEEQGNNTEHSGHSNEHAEHKTDHSDQDHSERSMKEMDHSGHDMSGHSEDEHAGHKMDHSESEDQDHSGHSMDGMDHSGHDMSGHSEDEHAGHKMDHSESADQDHSGHSMDGMDHSGHDMSGHQGHHDHGDDMIMDMDGGMIMGQNLDKLPSSCDSISEEVEITVYAGRKYAERFPGTAFAFDHQQWHAKPCSKITWHFVNEDEVRHQFMMHGLPKYLYKNGMFHLEVTGPNKISGTMIVPATDETYLVHCDIAQHMEKGMKAQLVVGSGGIDLPSIPGVTPYLFTDSYDAEELPEVSDATAADKSLLQQANDLVTLYSPIPLMMIIGILIGILSIPLITKLLLPMIHHNKAKNRDL